MSDAVRRARALFDAFERRDIALAPARNAPDAVWRFPGRRGALAGAREGREAIFAFLTRVSAMTGGTFAAERIDAAGDDRIAYFHFIGRARRGEKTLKNDTCLRLEFAGGLLIKAQERVWDLDHVENFLS